MVTAHTKKDCSLKEMPSQSSQDLLPERDKAEGPVTRSFLEAIFVSIKDNLQTVKRGLSQDLKSVHKDLAEIGDRVSTSEDNVTSRDEELKQLQQELIHLKEQHTDLQAHAEGL
ncbi:hypothetical protein NDU88_004686 [Pleurodeles waltl]|uniref:Uncharacterized protein n=1 Tax=Pleurodeles waltl TaxID=8319 RepID=A0AAV7UGV1_PLEWA|nr:hypothetical protein NDU88_004686 [Pleurodeles waltl]